MKFFLVFIFAVISSSLFTDSELIPDHKSTFIIGDAKILSINSITFGPEGILFIGDSKSAQIFAVHPNDKKVNTQISDIEIKNIDEKIGAKLGTDSKGFSIRDLAVNPVTKNIFVAIHMADGTPVLLRIHNGQIEGVSFNAISHSKTNINSAVEIDAKDSRGRDLRKWTISDMKYADGKLMVSGLSNREFSSTFTAIPFPFDKSEQSSSTLELYHAAHGRYETYAPIKTFTTAVINKKAHLIASYTCTPLVVYPLDELKSGIHVKGRTVAELGNRNTPLDIISVDYEGESYFLLANTSRSLMKISYKSIESFEGGLTEKVSENSGTAGAEFIALPLVNILQLDKLDDSRILMLQRKSNGNLDLYSSKIDRWM